MIIPPLGFTDVRAVRAGARPDPLLEAGPVDAALHVHTTGGVRGRRPPEVDLRPRPDAREPARPAVEALPEEGPPVRDDVPDMLWVFSEIAWEELLATVKIMNRIPYAQLTPARISAGFKAFRGPLVLAAAGGRVRQGVPGRAGCLRQPDPVLQLPRQGQVEARLGLAEAAHGRSRRSTEASCGPGERPGPPAPRPTEQMRDILLFAALGLGAGALIASIALGVVLIYRGSGIINVAIGRDRDDRAPTSSGRSGPETSASSSRPRRPSCSRSSAWPCSAS